MITIKKEESIIDEAKIVNQIRALGIDMIDYAKSGHPGIVLGAAPIIYTIYAHHLRFDIEHPKWFNRDRFIMSAGHGSALLYSTLHMAGFNIEIEDLKKFRKLDSITPGHPEYGKTPGVDMTTGPLGQGFASAVGIAMGEAHLRSMFNKRRKEIVDFYTYVLCGDGDLMEGISYEAASLAGTLKLNKLIVLYDSNQISLDGKTSLTFTENVTARFQACGWNTISVNNGEDIKEIDKAIKEAKASDRPTLIEVKTTIGKFSKLEGDHLVHGKPLEQKDISNIKKKMELRDIPFAVSSDTIEDFQKLIQTRNKQLYKNYEKKIANLDKKVREELEFFLENQKKIPIRNFTYKYVEGEKESLRVSASKTLNAIAKNTPFLFGGSADLFGACNNYLEKQGDFSSSNYKGRNIYFGVREHAMGAILNGLALVGFRPYGSTFLSFSDYLKPSLRLAALMNVAPIYIFTHDSISVGQDGPTHQPVEQLVSLRSTPNLEVFRPADANEVIGSFKVILEQVKGPSAIVLSRNEVDILDSTKISEVEKGGYIVRTETLNLNGIIIATGEEVHLALKVANRLASKGFDIRVVSMPNIKRFLSMDEEYREEILPVGIRKVVIERASSYSWNKLVFADKYIISIDEFGDSGTQEEVDLRYGFDIDSVEERVENLLK